MRSAHSLSHPAPFRALAKTDLTVVAQSSLPWPKPSLLRQLLLEQTLWSRWQVTHHRPSAWLAPLEPS